MFVLGYYRVIGVMAFNRENYFIIQERKSFWFVIFWHRWETLLDKKKNEIEFSNAYKAYEYIKNLGE